MTPKNNPTKSGALQAFKGVAFSEWGILPVLVVLVCVGWIVYPRDDGESTPLLSDHASIALVREVEHRYYRYASETVWAPNQRYGVFRKRVAGYPINDTIHIWFYGGDTKRMCDALNSRILAADPQVVESFKRGGWPESAAFEARFLGIDTVSEADYLGPAFGWQTRESPTFEGFHMWLNRGGLPLLTEADSSRAR